MSGLKKPYKRNARIFSDGQFTEGGRWQYIVHPKYAQAPEHYIRAFLLIQKDLQELFDYVEPSDKNLDTYSYRIHELLLRTCVEIEANFVAILTENGYSKSGDLNMDDYKKTEVTHRLSSYEVKMPAWNGKKAMYKPFNAWKNFGSLSWYKIYNETKHDRYKKFENATFGCLIEAVCGLVAVLTSQFLDNDFSPGPMLLAAEGYNLDDMEAAIGSYFRVKYPKNWKAAEKYNFDWNKIKDQPDPFGTIDYEKIII